MVFTIVGMHRTGSSLLANCLYDSGIFLGSKFLGATLSNKKGHFEDLDFLELHRRDLKLKQIDTDALVTIPEEQLQLEDESIAFADKFISERSSKDLWGWKEPRTALYIFHWKELIRDLKIIFLQKDKNAVVNSLYKREKRIRNPKRRNKIMYLFNKLKFNSFNWRENYEITYDVYINHCKEFQRNFPKILSNYISMI